MPGVTPRMRLMAGLSLFSISSTFFEVIAVLFGLEHREEGPAHDVGELVVAMAHDRSSGSLEMISGRMM